MSSKLRMNVAGYVEMVEEISTGEVHVNNLENYSTIDFRLDLENTRETSSSLVVDRRGIRILELRLPPIWDNTSQMRAQRRLDELIHNSGFPVRTYTYVRGRTMNPHLRLENPEMSDDELFSMVKDLIESVRDIQEGSPEKK